MILWRNKKRIKTRELNPDEILLDIHNLPAFDVQQFEGRMEKAIPKKSFKILLIVMLSCALVFVFRLGQLQIVRGAFYATRSEQNSLDHIPVFADRGLIYDRNGVELAWNTIGDESVPTFREYYKKHGFSSLLGYVSYPAKDRNGFFWRDRVLGKDGIEKDFDLRLAGQNGKQIVETSVTGEIFSGSVVENPVQGESITLSIDARVQEILFEGIKSLAEKSGYVGV